MSVIQVQLASPPLKRHARLFGETVRSLLQALVMVNRMTLRDNRAIPPLYRAGVRYIKEKPGVETFRDITYVLANKGGDCAHLAAWRVAELQEQGENASIRVSWVVFKPTRTKPGKRLFHVLVRRGDGRIEDPSKLLGMGKDELA